MGNLYFGLWLGNSRVAHLWSVRHQGLGVTHDWTVKRKHKSKSEGAFEECAQERRTVVPKSVREISASEDPTAQKPVLILLAGSAGAGKTTFYESQLKTVFPSVLKASASPIEQAETDRERSRLMKEGHSFSIRTENHVGSVHPGLGWFAPPKSIRAWKPTLLWNHFAVLSVKRSLRGFERKRD